MLQRLPRYDRRRMALWIDAVIRRPRLSLIWIRLFEPLLRFWPAYPPDWELRRLLVFQRASGRCEMCAWPIGKIATLEDGWRMVGAHVHHVKTIANGGRHGLANLRLVCARCHAAEHPENRWLRELVTPVARRSVP